MSATLEHLENCPSQASLSAALHAVCARFGEVARLDVLPSTQLSRHQALCFIRMDSPAQELALMRELGVGRFGGNIVIVVNLKNRWPARKPHFVEARMRESEPRWAGRSA